MSGHTPGPWRVGELCDGRIRVAATKPELTIAAVRALSDWVAMGEANARLIAAAPDLLAVTVNAERLISGELVGAEWKQACADFVKDARAAIAKATTP